MKLLYAQLVVLILLGLVTLGVTLSLVTGHIVPPAWEVEDEDAEPEPGEPRYLDLRPPLTVSLEPDKPVRFVQVEATVMTVYEETFQGLLEQQEAIRDAFLALLAEQRYETLRERAGREALQSQMVEIANGLLHEEEVRGEVNAVYLTGFVMQ